MTTENQAHSRVDNVALLSAAAMFDIFRLAAKQSLSDEDLKVYIENIIEGLSASLKTSRFEGVGVNGKDT